MMPWSLENPYPAHPSYQSLSLRRIVMSEQQPTRREVLKKSAYVDPAILTLRAIPAFAAKGSQAPKKPKERRDWKDLKKNGEHEDD
jgi:hypothetical protein